MTGKQSNRFEFSELKGADELPVPPIPVERELYPNGAQLQPPATRKQPSKSWRLPLVGLGICCLFVGVGGAAFWWLTTPPPSPDCRQISPLSTDMERLLCAQESARSGDLPKILSGLELLGQWTPEHPLYREAQRLIAEWSAPVLTAARQQIDQSDLRGAIELASRIPKTSPLYKDAQAAIGEWKRYWKQGETIDTAARQAMKAQNWRLASEKISLLKDFSQAYWRTDRVNTLSQLLTAEQQGRQLLTQAQATAIGQPEQLGAAIVLISRMDNRTFAWTDAQKPLKQWSETLLSAGMQNWLKGNLNDAMTQARLVLPNPNLAQTAQDLLWLSQARQHAIASTTTLKPTPPQLWNLSAAISTAYLIQPTSRYYALAQTNRKQWQAQFQDLTLLQLAWGIGETPQLLPKQFAIWQAQQITAARPRRAQAQTLVSYWQAETRKLEDQPYLTYAQQLAQAGSISALRSAIAQVALITPKRPLRQEAQTLIASWTLKIQTIEDQPLLDRAWAVANQGNLNGAIQVAAGVAPGRALYGQAQSAIAGWQASIRVAELARLRQQEALRKPLVRSAEPTPRDQNSSNIGEPPNASSYSEPPGTFTEPDFAPTPSYPRIPTAPAPSYPSPSYSAPPVYEPMPPSVIVDTLPAPPAYQPYEPAPPPPNP